MYSSFDPSRRLFPKPLRVNNRTRFTQPPADPRIAVARDRVALGYYDQPAFTEALVLRLMQTLAARDN